MALRPHQMIRCAERQTARHRGEGEGSLGA